MMMFGPLLERYEAVRNTTMALAEPLSDEDCCVQSMPDASPIKWHLAHTTWFFETFVLEPFEPSFKPFHPAFRVLFNSYYNTVGDKHPRPQRGLLTRPGMAEIEDYRSAVDARMEALLLIAAAAPVNPWPELARRVEIGLNHEEQHQELMLTDIKHLLWCNPLLPAYSPQPAAPASPGTALEWIPAPAGIVEIGHAGTSFCFDNELPRHRHYLEPFELASRLVDNGEYLAFIEAGGYENPEWWLSEGWDWVRTNGPAPHPLYWRRMDGTWYEYTLQGLQPLDRQNPALHLSYFEADAYARWAGARLPTEQEWECIVQNLETAGAEPWPMLQAFDTGWQWTSSSYAPYPGYRPADGALGEYNGKFMVNQYVLRGASYATPRNHSRPSYRNFFPSHARWQFTALRLARSR